MKLNVVDLKNMNQLDKELNISLVLTTVKKPKHLWAIYLFANMYFNVACRGVIESMYVGRGLLFEIKWLMHIVVK